MTSNIPSIPPGTIVSAIPTIPKIPKVVIPVLGPSVYKKIATRIISPSALDKLPIKIPKIPLSSLRSKVEAKVESVQKFKEKQMLATNLKNRISEARTFVESKYTFDTAQKVAEEKLQGSLSEIKKTAQQQIKTSSRRSS